jgi:hypothetical protein
MFPSAVSGARTDTFFVATRLVPELMPEPAGSRNPDCHYHSLVRRYCNSSNCLQVPAGRGPSCECGSNRWSHYFGVHRSQYEYDRVHVLNSRSWDSYPNSEARTFIWSLQSIERSWRSSRVVRSQLYVIEAWVLILVQRSARRCHLDQYYPGYRELTLPRCIFGSSGSKTQT